ncbi:hypothetical protein DFH06DRAFT_1315604 [Mycena polygramma]|nr:hypothetical protein DFH06DRAFT_1315577 [Mycena polygramma]KAJ7680867.1 hypothetical protein DFH06DRAFT_1315604 [Mycena polygramma]
MSTGGQPGDSSELPILLDEHGLRLGRIGNGPGPPSLIRQDIPRRRPETSIRAARVEASTSTVPRNPRHKPLRIIRRPVNGARTPQYPPLTRERLWLTEDRPPVVRALNADDLCCLCVNVKSHPVWRVLSLSF